MKPIATFSEGRFSGKRFYNLSSDKIRVAGKVFLQNEFDIVLQLNTINPDFSIIRIRDKAFWSGIWLMLGASLVHALLTTVFGVTYEYKVLGAFIVIGLAGAVLCLATFRKIEFYSFKNLAGITVLDIARSGSEKSKFDSFIKKLVHAIDQSKQVAEPVA